MPENKHFNISRDLEKAIRNGKYFERIPPVRVLAGQYGVSLQTMTKALKPLQQSGLLVSGPGGTRIMENIPYQLNSGVVTLFMLNDTLPVIGRNEDPLLQTLREEAARDGVTLVMMWVDSAEIFQKQTFWESRQTDGYIFIYSSFYPLVSKHLQISGIPYLAANWLPDSFNAHWIDWDWKKQLFDLVKLLIDMDYTRIAYMPNIHWKFGLEYHFDMWQDICESYGIYNYQPDMSYFGSEPYDLLDRMAQDPFGAPQVVIPTNLDHKLLHNKITDLQIDCRICLSGNNSNIEQNPGVILYSANDYSKLAREIWKLFRQISSGKAGFPRGHWVNSEKITIIKQ